MKISETFARLRASRRKALIPYCMGGYPSFDESLRLIAGAAEAGADVVEVGIPFSDPLADGPTIQEASQLALETGFTPHRAMDLVRLVRNSTNVPLVFMTYFNIVLHYGLRQFAADASEAGADGVILPDLPAEESEPWQEAAAGRLETVFLVSPTSTDERVEKVARATQGFLYAVSTTGVTGVREDLPVDLAGFLTRVRAKTDKPVCVGFGVSTSEQAKAVGKVSDGVIIGSALINKVKTGGVEAGIAFVRDLRQALDSA